MCMCVSLCVCHIAIFFKHIHISPISLGNSTETRCFPAAVPLLATVFVTVVVDRVPPQLLLEDWNCVGSPVSSAHLMTISQNTTHQPTSYKPTITTNSGVQRLDTNSG